MVISTAKSKATTIAITPVRRKLAVNNETEEQTQEVKNLEKTTSGYGSIRKEISLHKTILTQKDIRMCY